MQNWMQKGIKKYAKSNGLITSKFVSIFSEKHKNTLYFDANMDINRGFSNSV